MVFGVGSTDPVAYMATAIVFAASALIALCGPARLASRVDAEYRVARVVNYPLQPQPNGAEIDPISKIIGLPSASCLLN
jgi:hypothetical protein